MDGSQLPESNLETFLIQHMGAVRNRFVSAVPWLDCEDGILIATGTIIMMG